MKRYNWDVFLAHSGKDKTIVKQIHSELEGEGLKVWLDEEQIQPGDYIGSKIEEGLERSQRIIVCLSPSLGESNWVRAEYSSFLNEELSEGVQSKIVPLVVKEVKSSEIPRFLRDKLRSDYMDSDEKRKLIEFLKSSSIDRDIMKGIEHLYSDPSTLFQRFLEKQIPVITTGEIQELTVSFKKLYFNETLTIEDELEDVLRRLR